MIWRNESASLGDRVVEITEVEQKKEKGVKRNEERLRERDNVKCVDIHGIGAPQGEERGRGREHEWRHGSGKLPDPEKKTDVQVQEAQGATDRISPRRNAARHAIINLGKGRGRILKAAR